MQQKLKSAGNCSHQSGVGSAWMNIQMLLQSLSGLAKTSQTYKIGLSILWEQDLLQDFQYVLYWLENTWDQVIKINYFYFRMVHTDSKKIQSEVACINWLKVEKNYSF